MMIFIVSVLLITSLSNKILLSQSIPRQPVRLYKIDDWISFKNCNYPTSLDKGLEYIYFGTSGGVVPYHYYGRYWENPYTVSDGMAGDFVTAVLYDKTTNYLWAAHEKGISYLEPAADSWKNISCLDLHLPENNPVDRLGTDGNSIWVQAAGGFLFSINKILGFYQSSAPEIGEDIIWSPNSFDPLPELFDYIMNSDYTFMRSGYIMDREFREFPLSIFFIDQNMDIYSGAWGLGLIQGDENVHRLNVSSLGPIQNHINALELSDYTIWMGGNFQSANPAFNRSGISVYYPDDESWNYYESQFYHELFSDNIEDIKYDDNHLWIGTDEGLTILNTKNNRWKRISDTKGLRDDLITSIAIEDSIAWIGTMLGLNAISIPDFQVFVIPLTKKDILLRIYKVEVGETRIWILSDNGIYAIERSTRNIEHYGIYGGKARLDDPVAGSYSCITAKDSLVIFGRSQNLLKFNNLDETWTILNNIGYLTEVYVYDMAIDNDYLWLGTSGGAVLTRLRDFYTEVYTTSDGLAGNNVYRVKIDGDWVWFGTDRGLTKYQWRQYASKD